MGVALTKYVVRAFDFVKCGPVKGSKTLDAELGGCVVLVGSFKIGMQKCGQSY